MSLSNNLKAEKNRMFSTKPWLVFADVRLPDGTVHRFVCNQEDIWLATEDYDDAGCVLHLKLDDTGDVATAVDSSGNDYDASIAGGKLASDLTAEGIVGNAFYFDGSVDLLNITSNSDLVIGDGSYTWCFYMEADDVTSLQRIMFKNDGTPAPYNGYYAMIQNGTFRFAVTDADDSVAAYVDDTGYSVDTWYHITVVRNKTTGKLILYVDGEYVEQTDDISDNVSGTDDVMIGGRKSTSEYFDGKLDDIRFYNRALSQAEIRAIYNSGNGTAYVPQKYTAFNFQVDPVKKGSDQHMPTTKLRLMNISRFLQPTLREQDITDGTTITLTVANTRYLDENYAELRMTFDVQSCVSNAKHLEFTIGAPSIFTQRFPQDRYIARHCDWVFGVAAAGFVECAYTGLSVAGVTLSGSDPVQINVNESYAWDNNEEIELDSIGGITPSLDAIYSVSIADATTLKLLGTDSSGYSGAYSGGGTASHTSCPRTFGKCRQRQNTSNWGGFIGLRSGNVRVV